MERKKTSLIIIGICIFTLSIIGVSYAYWNLNIKQTGEDKLLSSCFEVSLINEGTAIHLENAFPILDSDGEALEPYTFTITNTCSTYAGYQINLESLGKSTDVDSRLNPDYLKVKINEENSDGNISKLGENDKAKETLNDAYESHKLMTGYLGPNESRNFELRLWLDGDLTTENSDAMNKTFASKVTVTASYIVEEKVPPTVDLELAFCGNTITATGSGTASGNKSITKYEFKLDENENWQVSETEGTTEFTVDKEGEHTVRLKVTDSSGITSEVTKTIDTTSKKVNIYGRDIPITTCKNGLYEVEHKDANITDEDGNIINDWKNTEYRYAGVNYDDNNNPVDYVHNYIWFNCKAESNSGETNCERWRIIGLVNVKTTSGIQKRLKILRDESIGNFSWDYKGYDIGSSKSNSFGSNDWTDSQLMELLNDGYYNSFSNVSCYKESRPTTCDFSGTDPKTKGLEESARDMIDKDIIWNIGGGTGVATVSQVYESERGTSVYNSNVSFARETEWKASNTGRASLETTNQKHLDESLFRGVALPYASDYGYATSGGGTIGRDACFEKELNKWNKWSNKDYHTNCDGNDWLQTTSDHMWTLSPNIFDDNHVSRVGYDGGVGSDNASNDRIVKPTVYLSSNVKIVDNENDGSYDTPYELQLGP